MRGANRQRVAGRVMGSVRDPPAYAAADAYSGLGDLTLKNRIGMGSPRRNATLKEARSWYDKSLSAWKRIKHPNRFTPNGFQAGDPASVARKQDRLQ
jgi:hypothetical protein